MELEWQWDFVEEDVPDIFGSLLKTVDASVVSLGETVRGRAYTIRDNTRELRLTGLRGNAASVPSETYSMLNGGMDSSVRHFHHNMKLVQDRLLSEVK